MLGLIIINEIKDYLKSLRFMLTCVLIILLMSAGAILFIPYYQQQAEDFTQKRNETLSQLSDMASKRDAIYAVFRHNVELP